MITAIKQKMEYIEDITRQLGYELNKGDYYIEDMGCPHTQPKKLPDGYAAIYIFIYQFVYYLLSIVYFECSFN